MNPDNYLVGSVLVIREKRNSGCAKKDRLSLDSLSFLTGADVELCVTLNEQEKMCAWEWGQAVFVRKRM